MPGLALSVSSGGGYVGGTGDPGGGLGPTSYNPLNSGPPTSGGSGGGPNLAPANPPKPPPAVSDPYAGRVTPDAPLEFLTFDGYHGATGTAQQLLDQLTALFNFNGSHTHTHGLSGNTTPVLRVPGGSKIYFDNNDDLTRYLTRSASPVVPTAAVSAAFQSVMGRPPSAGEVSQAEAAFNAGASPASYRAGLIASPEMTKHVARHQLAGARPRREAGRGRRLQGPAQCGQVARHLALGPFPNHRGHQRRERAVPVHAGPRCLGCRPRRHGGPACQRRLARRCAQDLANSQEARNAVATAFQAELGRPASGQNIADMQHSLATPNES